MHSTKRLGTLPSTGNLTPPNLTQVLMDVTFQDFLVELFHAISWRSCSLGFYSDIVSWILEEYGEYGRLSESSRLTRVHFHCLYVHILAVFPSHWHANKASVSKGSWTAFSQACDTEITKSGRAELRIPREFNVSLVSPSTTVRFDPDNPVSIVSNDKIKLYVSPVLVCKLPLKTVGLGDAISASGLLYNEFHE